MKRYRISEIELAPEGGHVFQGLLDGKKIYSGGLSFHTPGKVTHAGGPHTHADQEMFCLLQGEGWIEVGGVREPVRAGDVLLIEPGEDHHLISSEHNPLINLWLHADEEGHTDQRPHSPSSASR
jgi:quercetin dioxygenase-like cupin family protein